MSPIHSTANTRKRKLESEFELSIDIPSCMYSETETINATRDTYNANDSEATANGLSNFYDTKCILEGLGSTNDTSEDIESKPDVKTLVSVNFEYSVADIVDIIDDLDTVKVSIVELKTDNEANGECKEMTECEEDHVNNIVRTTDLDEVDICASTTAEGHKPFLLRSPLKSRNSSLTNMFKVNDEYENSMKKAYSLPYRSSHKKQTRKYSDSNDEQLNMGGLNKSEDVGDIAVFDIENTSSIDAKEVCNQAFIEADRNELESSFVSSEVASSNGSYCDLHEYTLTLSDTEGELVKKVNTSDTVQDISNYSEAISEVGNYSELEWDCSGDDFLDLTYSDSFTKGRLRKQRLRSDSFLEAVSAANDQDGGALNDDASVEPHIPSTIENIGQVDTEQAYFNHGYEFDDTDKASNVGTPDNYTDNAHELEETPDTTPTHADVDVVTFFF